VYTVGFRAFHGGFPYPCGCEASDTPPESLGGHLWMAKAKPVPVLGLSERGLNALGDHLALLLCERRIDVQREVVAVFPKCCNDEMHPMLHETADEMHVARQTVKPGNNQWVAGGARLL
jgi:hypothetical protein